MAVFAICKAVTSIAAGFGANGIVTRFCDMVKPAADAHIFKKITFELGKTGLGLAASGVATKEIGEMFDYVKNGFNSGKKLAEGTEEEKEITPEDCSYEAIRNSNISNSSCACSKDPVADLEKSMKELEELMKIIEMHKAEDNEKEEVITPEDCTYEAIRNRYKL